MKLFRDDNGWDDSADYSFSSASKRARYGARPHTPHSSGRFLMCTMSSSSSTKFTDHLLRICCKSIIMRRQGWGSQITHSGRKIQKRWVNWKEGSWSVEVAQGLCPSRSYKLLEEFQKFKTKYVFLKVQNTFFLVKLNALSMEHTSPLQISFHKTSLIMISVWQTHPQDSANSEQEWGFLREVTSHWFMIVP